VNPLKGKLLFKSIKVPKFGEGRFF